jgi:hypothetical protein
MGLFKKSLLMSEVRLHDERIGLSLGTDTLRLFLHTDTQQKNYESICLSRYNGYGKSLTDIRHIPLSSIVSVSIDRPRGGPYYLDIVTRDNDPIWRHMVVSTDPGRVDTAKEIVSQIKKVIH